MYQHDLQVLAYTLIILFSIGVSVGTGLFTLRRRQVAGARSFSFVLLLEATWTAGFLCEVFAGSVSMKIFWDNLQWIATLLIPLAMFAFSLEYTGRTLRRSLQSWVLLAAIPFLTLVFIYTNSWHGLAIHSIQLVQGAPFSEYLYQYGTPLWVGIIYSYIVTLMAFSFLIGLVSQQQGTYRAQVLIIIAGFFLPVLGTILTMLGVKVWQFRDFSPITFALSNLLVAVGLFRYRIFNLLPLARGLVVDSMEDGVIVLDLNRRLVDINHAAKSVFGEPQGSLIGQPVEALGVDWLRPADLRPGMANISREVTMPLMERTLDMRISCIFRQTGLLAGYLILLRDVSDRKRAETLQQAIYTEMEHQVAARTAELHSTVDRLEAEIIQRQNTEEALRAKSENLDAVSRLALQLAIASTVEEIIPLVAEYITGVTGALGSIVSVYDPQAGALSVKYIAAQGRLVRNLNRLRPDLLKLSVQVSPEIKLQMIHNPITRHASITSATFGAVPVELIRRVQKMLKVGEIISVILQVDGALFGRIMIFLPHGAPSPALDMLEAFSYIVSVTLRRNRAEEALRASEERFRTLLENANDIISVLDAQGNQLFTYDVNDRNRVLGFPRDEMQKMNLVEFVHPDDRAKAREIITRIIERPGNHELFELRYRHINGSYITLETYAKNLLDNPLIGGIVSTSRDITERKQAEEEQRHLNRTLGMISACNQALVRMDDEMALLEAICHIIVESGGHNFSWIHYLQEEPVRRLVPIVFLGSHDNPFAPLLIDLAASQNLENWQGETPELAAERHWMEAGLMERLPLGQPEVTNDIRRWPFPLHREQMKGLGIRSMIALPLVFGGEVFGYLHIDSSEYDAFDPKEIDLLAGLAQDVSFGIHARRMRSARILAEQEARQASAELNRAYESTLEGWSRALELRERETAGHSQRVVDLTLALASQLGIPYDELTHIRRGALLHDIGKMGIPDNILLKPAKLTPEDWEVMRKHPVFARDLLSGIPYLEPALVIPYYHHERWDGSGYPQGLKEEEIPLPARIFAVVDVWDALSWDRPYRKAWPQPDILQYLAENAGVLFDPRVVQLFLIIIDQAGQRLPFPALANDDR